MAIAQMIVFGLFFFLIGACIGSFLNVVIWRLPHRGRDVLYLNKRGPMTLSWPPSHCPMCDSPIPWHLNIPVLSYLLLRGKCARCRAPIPIRYPLVELAISMLWGGMFLAYFVGHLQAQVCWRNDGAGIDNLLTDAGPYVWHCVFASALLAASAIDADLFIIPLSITWFLAFIGLAGSTALGPPLTRDYAIVPTLTAGSWGLARPVLGAVAGLILANALLLTRLLPRSFPWELEGAASPSSQQETAETNAPEPDRKGKKNSDENKGPREEPLAPPPKLTRFWPSVVAALVIVAAIAALWAAGRQQAAALAGIVGAILVFLLGVLPRDAGQTDVTDDVMEEISGPGVRREILKEVLFLAIPLGGAGLACFLPLDLPQTPWLMRALGSLFGLLVGGGVVWLIRVGGSIAFNKQAMGIGDVHLMAGVGAVMGAPLVLIAFFTAPFVGILWAALLKLLGRPNVLPYGPWLSVASIMALFLGNPIISWYWVVVMGPRVGP
jgi:leader peptidase (prepilin peptidase) / N-methyltransferase